MSCSCRSNLLRSLQLDIVVEDRSSKAHAKSPHAGVVYKANTILTMEEEAIGDEQPTKRRKKAPPTHIACSDGIIVAVGNEMDVKQWIGPETIVVDLKDCVVTPGFIESHAHPLFVAAYLDHCDLSYDMANSKKEALEKLAEHAKTVAKSSIIIAWGYDPLLVAEEDGDIYKSELDKISDTRPILVGTASMHSVYVNSAVIKQLTELDEEGLLDEDGKLKNPPGGELIRDEKGELTGEFREVGATLLAKKVIPQLSFTKLQKNTLRMGNLMQTKGITTIIDATTGYLSEKDDFLIYQTLADKMLNFSHRAKKKAAQTDSLYEKAMELMPVRVVGWPVASFLDTLPFTSGFGNPAFEIGALKFMIDGSIQGFTAMMKDGYKDASKPNGKMLHGKEEIYAQMLAAHKRGFQLAIHCNGDGASEVAIDFIERILKEHPRKNHRHRLEHIQMPDQKQLERMKELGICPDFFANHLYYYGDFHVNATVGREKADKMNPMKSAEKLGLTWSIHSDAPVTPSNPLFGMWCAVNRQTRNGLILGENERVTPKEALKAITTNAAYMLFQEDVKGSIAIGKYADLTILDKNPLTVDRNDIKDIKVLGTVVAGFFKPTEDGKQHLSS